MKIEGPDLSIYSYDGILHVFPEPSSLIITLITNLKYLIVETSYVDSNSSLGEKTLFPDRWILINERIRDRTILRCAHELTNNSIIVFFRSQMDHKNNVDSKNNQDNNEKKKPHIKKPLNAFMLYMKEMRAKVVAECTLKESAAINQILGRRVRNIFFRHYNI